MTAPGSAFVRRAVRMTVIVPPVAWLLTDVLHLPGAAIPASFAMFALTVFAHFGGPRGPRLAASALTAAMGLVVITVACVAGISAWVAVPASLVAVFAIGYVGVLRGYFAPASAALLVPWIFGATSGTPLAGIPEVMLGWTTGAIAALLAGTLVWPERENDDLRPLFAQCLNDAAQMVTARWVAGHYDQAAMDRLDASIAALDQAFLGRADQPGAATSQDRGFLTALDSLRRLRTALWSDQPVPVGSRPVDPPPCDKDLARTTAAGLAGSAAWLTGAGPVVDPRILDGARTQHRQELFEWAGSIPTGEADGAYAQLAATFDLTTVSLTAEALVAGLDPTTEPAELSMLGRPRGDSARRRLAGQWALTSPWFRKALRTAVAIAVTVLIVKLSDVGFGLWVSLGAMAALKADSSGTRRSSGQIILGTIGGFMVGATLIALLGPWTTGYWIVVPVAVFLAAYSPGRTTLVVSQAAFTVFILMMVGISEPGRFAAAEMRVVNVTLGVTVSLLVSLAMWPRGAAAMVRSTIRTAADTASGFAVTAFANLTGEPDPAPAVAADQAQRDVEIARETLDLAVSQRGPGLPDVADWMLVLNTASQFALSGRIVTDLSSLHPLPADCAQTRRELVATSEQSHGDVVTAVTALIARPPGDGAGNVREAPWLAINRVLARRRPPAVAPLDAAAQADTAALIRRHADPDPAECGRGATAIAYSAGWAAQGAQLAQRLSALVRASTTQPAK